MKLIAYSSIISFIILAIITFQFGIHKKGRHAFITSLYIFAIVFTMYCGVFYAKNVPGASPDESAHLGYIYYLHDTNKIIPDFEDMHVFNNITMKWTEANYEYVVGLVNYLCHPPLYYHIMRLAGGFTPTITHNVLTIDKMQLRYFSMFIYSLGLALAGYIGWSRIDRNRPWLHLLYVATIASVPMLSFEFCAVTNDSLTVLTCCTCILGLIRFCEKRRNTLTYFLIAIGISASLLTKLTAALLCILMALIVLFATMISERSIKDSIKKEFFYTLPIYAIAIAYYVIVFNKYGSIPSLELICSKEYFKDSIFFTPEAERTPYTFGGYITYYLNRFFLSWSGIESLYRFQKTYVFSKSSLPYMLLWIAPFMFILPHVRAKAQKLSLPIIAGWIAILVTFAYQLKSAYGTYLTRGYLGGFASRYYIPFIPIFGLAIVFLAQSLLTDNGFNAEKGETTIRGSIKEYGFRLIYNHFIYLFVLVLTFMLFYGNLPFFLFHFGELLPITIF